jgi:hypothetical protein
MTRRFDPPRDDVADRLEADLRALGAGLAYPRPGPAFAGAVSAAIAARAGQPWWRRIGGTRLSGPPLVRRSVLIAMALLLLTVAVAAAIGFGVPGIRILLGPPPSSPATAETPTPTPSAGLPTFLSIFLGERVELEAVEDLVGFSPRVPASSAVQAPARAYVDDGRLSLVWEASPALPETESRGIGLLITEFRGSVDPGWYEKVVHTGSTTLEEVEVDGHDGYWVSGDPHGLVYREPDGTFVEETRRIVGDVLIWNDGEVTFRIETSLGRDAAIEIAESLD